MYFTFKFCWFFFFTSTTLSCWFPPLTTSHTGISGRSLVGWKYAACSGFPFSVDPLWAFPQSCYSAAEVLKPRSPLPLVEHTSQLQQNVTTQDFFLLVNIKSFTFDCSIFAPLPGEVLLNQLVTGSSCFLLWSSFLRVSERLARKFTWKPALGSLLFLEVSFPSQSPAKWILSSLEELVWFPYVGLKNPN